MDDYFAGSKPSGGPPPPPQAPPQWTPHGATPPNPFGPPQPSNPFGPSEPAPPWGAPPPPPWGHQPASGGPSNLAKVLIGVGAFLGVGILVAIAVGVFLNESGKSVSDRTTVSLPASIAGFPLRTDPAASLVVQALKDVEAPGVPLAGAYGGTAQPELVVMVTKHYMTKRDQRDYFTGVRNGAKSSAGLTLGPFSSVDAGALGGKVECASAPLATLCVFADPGAYGMIITFGTRAHALELLPQVRSAVEHRT